MAPTPSFKTFPMFIAFIINCGFAIGQTLPTVTARGGSGQNVNWPEIKKTEESDSLGPGFFYCDCCQGVKVVSATSTLAPQGAKNYSIKNLTDGDPMTAWVEGKAGYGIGESFTVEAPNVNSIYNGYQSTPANWKNNSRVKKFKVYSDGKPLCYLVLQDEMSGQLFELPLEATQKEHLFKFEIVEVYKGLKWDDVAISHIDRVGCCMASETLVTLLADEVKPVNKINDVENILSLDLSTGTISGVTARVVSQVHLSLLEVIAGEHRILVTPDHPLYIKDIGFLSLTGFKASRDLDRFDQLNGVEVLVWDDSGKGTYFEKISSVKYLSGEFKTYTLKGLSKGSAYIAGGFVTKSY